MLQVENQTPFVANLAVFPNLAGVETLYGAVKATFDLSSGKPRLAPKQAPFLATDVYWGDPVKTSLRAAGEIVLSKPATDVLLCGRAVAASPAEKMDVSLRVGPVAKSLRVFGNRRWIRRDKEWGISDSEPFERMPLRWELAFGGTGRIVEGKPPEHEPRNPVGRGFIASYDDQIQDVPLPNLEDPSQPIASPYDRPAPVCFCPVAPVWMPRRAYAGTYDETWKRTRAPFLPLDFDPRYLNVAPPDLGAADWLVGGEDVEIAGCTAGGPMRFRLPIATLALQWDFDGRTIDGAVKLDTVLIEPDQARLQMIWRSELAVDKKLLRMRRMSVTCAEYPPQQEAA
jgi:hypothetical protein